MSDTDDIFAVQSYSQQRPPSALKFEPWHRPRKQYVREEQWLSEYQWLGGQRPDGATIRYLGLPGADMLDLRYLTAHPAARQRNQILRFLGFDQSAKAGTPGSERLNISERELRDLPMVDDRSKVYADEFKLLAREDSVAWQAADEFECFDLINLDLCGSLTLEEPDLTLSNYDAILALMGLQRYQRRPWSIFLTTRVGSDKIHPEVRAKLFALFAQNLDQCAEFANAVGQEFEVTPSMEADLDGCSQRAFFQVTVAALSKWMLKYAIGMHAHMELSSVAAYQVYGGSGDVDMASLVFRFIPEGGMPMGDPAALASQVPTRLDECMLAAPIPHHVARVVDIDALLSADAPARERLTSESADLLELAHYDRAAYLAWAADDRA
ncbi:hypothetical protein SAMN05428985_109116 [Nocardioides sp. YR527]|uniref:PP_RS20740 family protein n=1 Tax=Nocardioides sp. YR527 TaxID=1881028 RepID=UPI0008838EDD|nr:hypothetical protein [Nocardioides sp. YR527]SDL09400.1 hypothetical protein SAMN05428985_109116 [Nocardioides sp. YR527]